MSEVVKIYGLDFALISKLDSTSVVSFSSFLPAGSGAGPTPPAPEWVSRFYGTDGFVSAGADPDGEGCTDWDGEKFVAKPGINIGSYLVASGTWANDYRPTKMRITYTGLSESEGDIINDVSLVDSAGFGISIEAYNYVSGDPIDLTFNASDIKYIYLYGGAMGSTHTWAFDDATASGGPASGYFRLNNANPSLVTEIYIDDSSFYSEPMESFLNDLINHEGTLRIVQSDYADLSCDYPYVEFTLNSVSDEGDFHTLSVTYIGSNGDFTADSEYEVGMGRNLTITNVEFYEDTTAFGTWGNHFHGTSGFVSNDFWVAENNRFEDGYDPGYMYVTLDSATWQEDYRPTKIMITGTPVTGGGSVSMSDNDTNYIVSGSTQDGQTYVVLPITWYGSDLLQLNLGGFTIVTNIQFYIPATAYTLNMTVSSGSGTLIPGVGNTTYYTGSTQSVVATADTGYEFAGWAGDTANLLSTDASTYLKSYLYDDTSISAGFTELTEYYLSIGTAGTGSGTIAPASGTVYYYNTQQDIHAYPASLSNFVQWTGDADHLNDPNSAHTYIISPMYDDTDVQAEFTPKTEYNKGTKVATSCWAGIDWSTSSGAKTRSLWFDYINENVDSANDGDYLTATVNTATANFYMANFTGLTAGSTRKLKLRMRLLQPCWVICYVKVGGSYLIPSTYIYADSSTGWANFEVESNTYTGAGTTTTCDFNVAATGPGGPPYNPTRISAADITLYEWV